MLQPQSSHQVAQVQDEVVTTCRYRARLYCWGPAAEPTLPFIPRPAARKGLEPAVPGGWPRWVHTERPQEGLPHRCETSQPGFPSLGQQHPEETSCCQDGHLQHEELGASCGWGTEAEEPGLRRQRVRKGVGTSSTELLMF